MSYVGTFISGFENYIEKLLKKQFSDVEIVCLYDGLIIFKTSKTVEKIPFFNNVYLLLNKTYAKSMDFNKNIKDVIKTNINYNNLKNIIDLKKNKTFKIKAFKENQPTKFDYRLVSKMENDIKDNLKLRTSNNPDIEFVIQQRSEGIILLMLKITNNRLTEKNIAKGSLRPELSYLLVEVADLQDNDIVLDPFFGSGSIPKTIVKHFKYNMCFASEIDHNCVENLKKEYKKNNKKLFIKEKDATKLDCFEDNFIDAIITDPPWNIFNKNESINFTDFYKSMLLEFNRILKENGRAIILMGNQNEFEKALYECDYFKLDNTISILVNGKKANIYCLSKK